MLFKAIGELGCISQGVGESDLHELEFLGVVGFDHLSMGEQILPFDPLFDVEPLFPEKDDLDDFSSEPDVEDGSDKEENIKIGR